VTAEESVFLKLPPPPELLGFCLAGDLEGFGFLDDLFGLLGLGSDSSSDSVSANAKRSLNFFLLSVCTKAAYCL